MPCISEAQIPANKLQAIQPDLQARVARAQRAQLFNRGSSVQLALQPEPLAIHPSSRNRWPFSPRAIQPANKLLALQPDLLLRQALTNKMLSRLLGLLVKPLTSNQQRQRRPGRSNGRVGQAGAGAGRLS